MAEPGTETEELTVTFHPALFLQRRRWVFEVMRRENVASVVDIGCGEGETIACLCNAAPWRAPPTEHAHAEGMQDVLYIRNIHALDVSAGELKLAKAVTAPPPTPPPGAWQGQIRWEPLDVKLWEGGLEVFNPEFVDAECIISTEVVEHLPEDILPEFAPMLLGVYHPRLLLITTPSYDFNARFTAPDAPVGTRKGFLDPTGRTDRIFRHSDHKFEWTVTEFSRWCTEAAEEWGYDVEISGVGKALEKDEWGRDEELGFASQVAAFSRKPGAVLERMREANSAGTLRKAQSRRAHSLFATHQYTEHASSGKPTASQEIQALVKQNMRNYKTPTLPVHDLWHENDVSILCGGWLHLLLEAVEHDSELTLHRRPGKISMEWTVEFLGFVAEEEPPSNGQETASTVPATQGWESTTGDLSPWGSEETDSSSTDSSGAASWGWSSEEAWSGQGWGQPTIDPGRVW